MLRSVRVFGLSRVRRRFYSSDKHSISPSKSNFDKSMLKPALAIVLFGSMLTSVMEQQKRNASLERRYSLKLGVLQDLIEKINNGEGRSIDVDRELALVNKLFERFELSKSSGIEEEAAKIRKSNDRADAVPHQEVSASLNGQKVLDDDASLRDLFKDIMKEVDEDVASSHNDTKSVPVVKKSSAETVRLDEPEIQTNQQLLTEEAVKEKQWLAFKPTTDSHIIVEKPGEYSAAAEDHTVSKFL